MTKTRSAIEFFATLEAEIAKYKVPPPKPWPWSFNSNGTTDLAIRCLQLLEFLEDLRKTGVRSDDHQTNN